ncbi:hypothetical protein [Pseudomonas sp. ZS001]|uniref:hypothetical protein n=1 Tax=Pseudomonas sp. ZS001 TaxID=3138070 RepID=UPI003139B73B
MSSKYAVVIKQGIALPEREILVRRAWGDVPASYIQDQEVFNECRFLDLKVNKWVVNKQWSNQQNSEPWIRVEMLKGGALKEYLRNESCSLSLDVTDEALVILELDEGGLELDEVLLLSLVSAFHSGYKIYRWVDGFQEVGEDIFISLPTQHAIRERLLTCA